MNKIFFLQFTENGLFALTPENEDKYGFPHPYEGGFSESSQDRIVAPFWADVDLTADIGNVCYQVCVCYVLPGCIPAL